MPAIGSEAQNGEWAIKFVQEVRMPSLGSAYSPKRAQGEFLVLDLILTNQGKRTMSLNDWASLSPICLRRCGVIFTEGDSSMIFWWRRWMLHSRSPRLTTEPNESARI